MKIIKVEYGNKDSSVGTIKFDGKDLEFGELQVSGDSLVAYVFLFSTTTIKKIAGIYSLKDCVIQFSNV